MNHGSIEMPQDSTDFAVEELDSLDAPGWNDVVQVTTAGGAAFVIGLSIT
ncbi:MULTISPECIES: hypothetical protein [Streptomyces]|uniref:Uncharacterized protein n=1 Tax=Streptomyces alboflavus TaxID=67267 RepID=A0A1Z1WEV4_9ACTN|nr:hypothetical protein [Streptomyces alboflavus]ARX84976.1 hypothetical protein SMD44_04434 [Streptomyces alboflavus]